MHATGKGLVTLALYCDRQKAERPEDQVQIINIAALGGKGAKDGVGATLSSVDPIGITTFATPAFSLSVPADGTTLPTKTGGDTAAFAEAFAMDIGATATRNAVAAPVPDPVRRDATVKTSIARDGPPETRGEASGRVDTRQAAAWLPPPSPSPQTPAATQPSASTGVPDPSQMPEPSSVTPPQGIGDGIRPPADPALPPRPISAGPAPVPESGRFDIANQDPQGRTNARAAAAPLAGPPEPVGAPAPLADPPEAVPGPVAQAQDADVPSPPSRPERNLPRGPAEATSSGNQPTSPDARTKPGPVEVDVRRVPRGDDATRDRGTVPASPPTDGPPGAEPGKYRPERPNVTGDPAPARLSVAPDARGAERTGPDRGQGAIAAPPSPGSGADVATASYPPVGRERPVVPDTHARRRDETRHVTTPEAMQAKPSAPRAATGRVAPPLQEAVAQPVPSEPRILQPDALPDAPGEGIDIAQTATSGRGDPTFRAADADHRPPIVARGAVAQIAEALRAPSEGTVEIRLSPEELGRVRLSMTPGEAGLVVQLSAERPETLDLLRRHVELLAADLRDLGYTGLEFSFGREERDAPLPDFTQGPPDARPSEPTPPAMPARAVPARGLMPDRSLDIRL